MSHRCVRRRLNDDDDKPVGNISIGPSFFGGTHVKDITDLLSNTSMSTHMSKIHNDQIRAPSNNIAREDMLEYPCDLDHLSRFLYQVHERLSGGLQ